MLVIARALVLSPGGINLTHPLIGWHNLVSVGGIQASTQESGFPASNLANPATYLKWRGATDVEDEYLTIATNTTEPIDYLAVAGHNFGTAQIAVSIEGLVDGVFVELVQEQIPPDDGPLLFRFAPESMPDIRIRLRPGLEVPEAAVVYCGALLVMERGFPAPGQHTPLDYGREANVVNGMSESGQFLGRIVLGEFNQSTAAFQHLTADWYRTYFAPFVLAAKEIPFFFAWKPGTYPQEVGYAWLTDSPKPAADQVTGRMSIALPMRGVV